MTGPEPLQTPDFDSFEWDSDSQRDIFGDAEALSKARYDPEELAPVVDAKDSSLLEPDLKPVEPISNPYAGVNPPEVRQPTRRRSVTRWKLDPLFAYVVLMGLSFGLTPLASSQPNGRYAIMWTLMTLVVLASRILDDGRLEIRLNPNQLLWGAGWGVVVGLPLLLVGPGILADVSRRIFVAVPDGTVFQTIVFIMATTETAFFRGLVQDERPAGIVAAAASLWSILLFFPTMDVIGYPSVALIAGTFIVLLNILYSYVRQRNGTAAAWVTQTLVSLAWLFLPRL